MVNLLAEQIDNIDIEEDDEISGISLNHKLHLLSENDSLAFKYKNDHLLTLSFDQDSSNNQMKVSQASKDVIYQLDKEKLDFGMKKLNFKKESQFSCTSNNNGDEIIVKKKITEEISSNFKRQEIPIKESVQNTKINGMANYLPLDKLENSLNKYLDYLEINHMLVLPQKLDIKYFARLFLI